MAIGDAATAAGLDTVPGTDDLRETYIEHNKTRDYLAEHQTSGTHDATAINAGILDVARIPDIPGTKITGTVPAATTATSATSAGSASSASSAYRATGSDGPHAGAVSGAGPYYSAWVDGDHNFKRNTSSRRYKKRIRDFTVTLEQLAKLRTRMFDRKNGSTNEPGLIAEEVHEVFPEVVTLFWETDDQGNQIGERQIDGIRYDVLGALGVATLAPIVANLLERIAKLEGMSHE